MPKDNERTTFTTSINPDLKKRFKIYCAVHNLYQNEVIEELISNLLDKEDALLKSDNKDKL